MQQRLTSILLNPRRWALQGLGALIAAQAATVGILVAVDRTRKGRKPFAGFPRLRFEETDVEGNSLLLYCYGKYLFDDMLAAIDSAQTSILLETFIWKNDTLGRTFKQRLIAKAEAGVQVYIIFDDFANLVVPRAFKRFPPSVHALEYGSFTGPLALLDPRSYARDHRKLLVVDGTVAFVGGYNIGDLYQREWRDTHVRVRGEEAARLGQAFIDFWNRQSDEVTPITWQLGRGLDPRLHHRTNDAKRMLFPIRDMYVDIIDRAQQRVLITNAYFIPDRVVRQSLCNAAARGVDVQVLLPYASNHVTADWLGRGFYTELLHRKVRIFCYRGAMNHAKTMTVDGQWSTVGTANLDRLSQLGNYEINMEIYDRPFAAQMERLFAVDKTSAFELSLHAWLGRPWYAKIGERILAPLRPLF